MFKTIIFYNGDFDADRFNTLEEATAYAKELRAKYPTATSIYVTGTNEGEFDVYEAF